MDNKAMYMHTVNDRDSGSIFEEPFDGRSLSKLNLCEDGEYFKLSRTLALPTPWPWLSQRLLAFLSSLADAEYWIFGGPFCVVFIIHLNKPMSSAR